MGAIMFNKWFKDLEFRLLISMAFIVWCSNHIINLIFVLRLNLELGIDDITFITIATVFHDALGVSFLILPMTVLFAKLTPKHIEATVFAMLTGIVNLSIQVLSPLSGAFLA
jgi:hypothetical protein